MDRYDRRSDFDSLAPRADRARILADVESMTHGQELSLLWLSLLAAAVLVSGALWLRTLDQKRALSDSSAALERLVDRRLDAFVGCAAQQTALRADSPALFQSALERHAARGPRAFGLSLARCIEPLRALQHDLAALRVPPALGEQLRAVTSAAAELEQHTHALSAYLAEGPSPRDYVRLSPRTERVALAIEALRKERTSFAQAVRAQL